MKNFIPLLLSALCTLSLAQSANAIAVNPGTTTLLTGNNATWFYGGPASDVTNEGNSLNFKSSAATAEALTYFKSTNIAVGQTLTLSFNYLYSTNVSGNNAFTFGLYNSKGSKTAVSGDAFNSSVFTNYTGYVASGALGSGNLSIDSRTGADNNLLSLSSYTQGQDIRENANNPIQFYGASLAIARTATGITVTSIMGNTVDTQTYVGGGTTFDTVGIFSESPAGQFIFGNAAVVLGPSAMAPEPSATLALVFLGAVAIGHPIRRKLGRLTLRGEA